MAKTANYSWKIYGGDADMPACAVVAYYSDPDHTPNQWQEDLEGQEKANAIVIVQRDRAAAETTGLFYEYEISAGQRLYLRTSRTTGNSWEIQKDEDGKVLPNPCLPAGPDPRDLDVTLSNCRLQLKYSGRQVTLTLTGNLPQA